VNDLFGQAFLPANGSGGGTFPAALQSSPGRGQRDCESVTNADRTNSVLPTWRTKTTFAAILAIALALAAPASAASPSLLPGAGVGLVPPEGMVPSQSFQGYQDAARGAMLFITELNSNNFEQVDKDFTPETLAAGGIEAEVREDAALAGMRGYLIIAHQDI